MQLSLKKIKVLLLIILASITLNIKTFDFSYPSFNYKWALGIGSGLLGGYVTYKINKNKQLKKLKFDQDVKNENEYVNKHVKITSKTIFAWDIDGVLLKYDLNGMRKLLSKNLFPSTLGSIYNFTIRPIKTLFNPYFYRTTALVLYDLIVNMGVKKQGLTPEQIIDNIYHDYPNQVELALAISNCKKVIPDMDNLVQKLAKSKYRQVINSNVGKDEAIEKSSIHQTISKFPWFNNFDLKGSFLTSKENEYLRKPFKKAFEEFKKIIREAYGEDALQQVIFIDDKLENVIAARGSGITSIWFINYVDLLKKLENQGLQINLKE